MKKKPAIQFDHHDYDYLDTLDKDGWHWEFTRRNENYRKAYEELTSLLEKSERCQRLACAGCTYGEGKKREDYVPCAFDVATYIFCIFNIRPKQRHTDFFPEPALQYPDIPDSLKPVTAPIGSSAPLKGIIGPQLINHVIRKVGHQSITLDADRIVGLIGDILSPRQVTGIQSRTLFIGIDLDSTREDLRQAFEDLLKKHVRPKISIGDTKLQPEKRKSGLMVWDIRRNHRLSLKEAGHKISIAEDTAKKQYYKIHELIYGEKYDPVYFEKPVIKKDYLAIFCDLCPEKPTCKDSCPEVIAYVLQDGKASQREQLFGDSEYMTKYARNDVSWFMSEQDNDPLTLLIQKEEAALREKE